MKKSILCLLMILTLCLCLVFASCGKEDNVIDAPDVGGIGKSDTTVTDPNVAGDVTLVEPNQAIEGSTPRY